MSTLYKSAAIFFAAILIFLGIYAENYGLLLTSQLQSTQNSESDSYCSTEKPELLFLDRHEERLVNTVKNQPVPGFKNHSNNVHYNNNIPGVKLLSINSGYISYSVIIGRSLTNSDIVFPFHYFW